MGPDDWEAVCSAETIGLKYGGDAVKVYADRDKLLAKYGIDVDETESPYPRPTGKVGPRLTFHIIGQDLTIRMVEGGGFLLQYGNIPLRSLGWVKDEDARLQSWEMTFDIAEGRAHAGSTLAELDSLEQRILKRFPQPLAYLQWVYIVDMDGVKKPSNLPQPCMKSRFAALDDARARKTKGKVAAAAQARYHSDLGTTAADLALGGQAGGPQLPCNADGSINAEKANKILQNMYSLIQFNKRLDNGPNGILLDGATAEDPFVTPTKKAKHSAEEQWLGPSAWPSHVRPARGSVPPLGEHYPPLSRFIGHVMLDASKHLVSQG